MSAESELERLQFSPVGHMECPIWGATLSSAASIAPTHYMHVVSGTTEITTITLPHAGFQGTIALIPSGTFTLNTGGNIAIAATAVVNKVLFMTYHPGLAKWIPSYLS